MAHRKRIPALTMVTETGDGEGCLASKVPRLEHSGSGTSHADPRRDSTERLLQPAVPQQESRGSSGVPSTARDAQQDLGLKHPLQQLQSKATDAEDMNDDAHASGNNAFGMQSEFMGDEHDFDDEAEEEDFLHSTPHQLAKMTMGTVTSI